MKICPDCKNTYDDSVDNCEIDGVALLKAATLDSSAVSLRQRVQSIDPDDATSMVDLEAMEEEFKKRAVIKQQEDLIREHQKKQEEKERQARLDPEATGTLFLDQHLSIGNNRSQEQQSRTNAVRSSSRSGSYSEQKRELNSFEAGKTIKTKYAHMHSATYRDSSRASAQQNPVQTKDKYNANSIILILILLVALAAMAGAAYWGYQKFIAKAKSQLHVQTFPDKATFILDDKEIGLTPLSVEVEIGTHLIELKHKRFKQVYQEVIEITEQDDYDLDLNFIEQNQETKKTQGLKETQQNSKKDLNNNKNTENPKESLGTPPKSLHTKSKIKKQRSTTKIRAKTRNKHKNESKANIQQARLAYQEGERQYRGGQFSKAKKQFKTAISLDGRFYFPHRSIARIYQKEGNSKRARYHLKKYLKLGGPDPDGKVKNFLNKSAGF